ncbi:hypothetical protein CYMTET_33497 [Cymbomonas tetramitiformis]|uniref:Tim44-like domain-containing protein n=1 Tax=Cymbomonas tetramitiformis TaxID=36881 RepID=A0AAE0FDJ2_9CHLO|nr:hypothetical protein CYMTET_33497 [Cymbomonas tetramitiformis]
MLNSAYFVRCSWRVLTSSSRIVGITVPQIPIPGYQEIQVDAPQQAAIKLVQVWPRAFHGTVWGEDTIRSPGIKITQLELRRDPAAASFRTGLREPSRTAPFSTSSDSRPPGQSDRKETASAGSMNQAEGKKREERTEQEGEEAVVDGDEGAETQSKVSSPKARREARQLHRGTRQPQLVRSPSLSRRRRRRRRLGQKPVEDTSLRLKIRAEETLSAEEEEAWKQLKGNTKVQSFTTSKASPSLFNFVPQFLGWCLGRITVLPLKFMFDFDEEEFLQGAETAFYTVNGLFAEGELDALEPLVHEEILQAMRKTCDLYKRQDVTMEMEVEDVNHMQVAVAGLEYFGARSEREHDHAHVQLCLSVHVRFESRERTRLYHKGVCVSDMMDERGHTWKFVRGPFTFSQYIQAKEVGDAGDVFDELSWIVRDLGEPQGEIRES